jgi:hypothetical protein
MGRTPVKVTWNAGMLNAGAEILRWSEHVQIAVASSLTRKIDLKAPRQRYEG